MTTFCIASPYDPSEKSRWDDFVEASRNATFLFRRDFMDYHADRFVDASLMFEDAHGRLKGLLPASLHLAEGEVRSHGGLTYGGFLLSPATHAQEVEGMLLAARDFYVRHFGIHRIIFRPIPSIYHRMPADDELYWFFRYGMKLTACTLSSTVHLQHPAPFAELRRRGVRRAERNGLCVQEASDAMAWREFWTVLADVLALRHDRHPVHSIEEMLLLRERFPENIALFVVREGTASGRIVGGTVLFFSAPVVHAQYISASDAGCQMGALDLLFHTILKTYSESSVYTYFDFGISTEDNGYFLNTGLNAQKEGFGARSVVYNTYTWDF